MKKNKRRKLLIHKKHLTTGETFIFLQIVTNKIWNFFLLDWSLVFVKC